MAISTTTFEERISRIEAQHAKQWEKTPGRKRRRGILTFPFLVGTGTLTCGTAYAYASTLPDMQWLLTLAP